MILDKFVKIIVTEKNISRAKVYNEQSNIGDEIIVPVENLFFSERVIIKVKCDNCGFQYSMIYVNYSNNVRKNNNLLLCTECCKYEKTKKTCLEKYGVENVSYLKDVINKRKETSMKNWNETNHMKNEIFLKNYKKKNKEKYGYDMPFNSIEIQHKCSLSVKNKYGVDNVFQNNEIKEKIKKTNLEKYGVEIPLQSEEIREKFIKTMINKYGVDNPSKYQEFKDKVINIKIKKGYIIKDDNWSKYKREVRVITSKYKKVLLENWNGCDYYDNEYIKENFNLNYCDKKYPTIDHKISIISGFINNISPDIIGGIDNLCYTKRTINSKKNYKNEINFYLDNDNELI